MQRAHKRNLTSHRMGHTGQTRHFVILRRVADPLLLSAKKGCRVNHRVRAVAQTGKLDGGLLLHGNDSAAAQGTAATAATSAPGSPAGGRGGTTPAAPAATAAAAFASADLPTVRPAASVPRRGCGATAADFLQHLASHALLRRMPLHSAK